MEVKLNLRQTREVIDAMIDEGVVHELTAEECAKHMNMHVGHTFCLVDPSSVPMGDIDDR